MNLTGKPRSISGFIAPEFTLVVALAVLVVGFALLFAKSTQAKSEAEAHRVVAIDVPQMLQASGSAIATSMSGYWANRYVKKNDELQLDIWTFDNGEIRNSYGEPVTITPVKDSPDEVVIRSVVTQNACLDIAIHVYAAAKTIGTGNQLTNIKGEDKSISPIDIQNGCTAADKIKMNIVVGPKTENENAKELETEA